MKFLCNSSKISHHSCLLIWEILAMTKSNLLQKWWRIILRWCKTCLSLKEWIFLKSKSRWCLNLWLQRCLKLLNNKTKGIRVLHEGSHKPLQILQQCSKTLTCLKWQRKWWEVETKIAHLSKWLNNNCHNFLLDASLFWWN